MKNEKQLIDVKPLMQNGWHLVRTGESNRFLASMSLADVPVVDAVEVIRCKDCEYRHSSEFCECKPDDGYCNDGERRSE